MKKRLISLLLTVVMLLSLVVVPANAALVSGTGTLTITPNVTSVKGSTSAPAEVIYTIKVTPPAEGPVGEFHFNLKAPDGMTLSEVKLKPQAGNKGGDGYWVNMNDLWYNPTTEEGVFETFEYTPDSKYFQAFGTSASRNMTAEADIMTIKATIAAGKVGDFTLTAENVGINKNGTDSYSVDVKTTPVTITKAPIDSVTASVKKPEAGKKLDFTGTVDGSAPYSITKVEWFESTDASGTPVTAPATAKAEQYYYARITLTAKPGETFAESLDNTVSGDYSVARNSDTELYLTKAYPKTGNLTPATVTAPTAKADLKYNGTKQVLLASVATANGGTVQYSLDNSSWSTDIPTGKDAKTYTVYYKAVGDSTHSDSAVANIQVTIGPKDISGVTIGVIADQTYTGSAITPDPEVKDGTTPLVKGKDYTVSCTDQYVGSATLTIKGKGNYTGETTANFTIVAADQNPSFTTPVDLVTGGHRLDLTTLVNGAKGNMTFTITSGTAAKLETGNTLVSTGITGVVTIKVSITAKDVNTDGKNEYNEYNKSDAITVNVIDKTTDTDTMTVTQDGMTYGETLPDYVLSGKPAGAGTDTVLYTGTLRNGSAYSNAAKPTEAGTYKVKVKCETATKIYEATSADFTIEPKSISGVTVTLDKTSLEYTGSAQTVSVTGVTGLSSGDYTVTGETSGTNVGSYTVKVTGKGNYKDTATATWEITQATPSYTVPTDLTAKYGQTLADVNIAATTGWSWMDSTQSVGNASTTPKTFKAKFTPTDANYKTVENIEVSVAVGKADARTLEDITVKQKYTVTTGEKAIGAVMPDDADTLTYVKGTASKTGSVTIDSWNVDTTTGKVTYTLSGGKANDTVTLPVTITSTNYADSTVNVVITLIKGSSGGYYYAPTVPDMPMLYRGCTGDAVKTLQDKLNALGYNSGSVDGIFGAKTYAAVTAFQKANSLGVDGIVGKLTWGKLYGVSPAMPVETTTVVGRPTVSYGSRGDAVRKLQELLNALGYDCGSVDGIFGSKTKAAVLAFQKANGLGVDGIVGPLTWAKLG